MAEAPSGGPILSARDITHRYGGVLALSGVSLDVPRGAFLSVLGANGAGKSTLGLILSGVLTPTSGTVSSRGQAAARRGKPLPGVGIVPEGRRLFGQLTVAENLLLGGYGAGVADGEMRKRMQDVLAGLPKALRDDPGRHAAMLSGGEQQMLAIGRALMAGPEVLIIDEPSMGLAPILIEQVYAVLARLRREGVTVILLEQMATHAVRHSDRLVVLDRGRIVYEGSPQAEGAQAALLSGYIGTPPA